MQFQYNSDYPGLTAESVALGVDVGVAAAQALAADPREFPPAQPIPCARITTRIYHPSRNEVSTVQNVLVRTMARPPTQQQATNSMQPGEGKGDNSSMSSDDFSVSSSSSSAMSDMDLADGNGGQPIAAGQPPMAHDDSQDRAYWIQRTLREAIYGRVLFATVLRRRYTQHQPNAINADWEVTSEFCAVKEMSRQLIRKERDRLAEDPIKEVSAMQYLRQWHESRNRNSPGIISSNQAVMDTHVMMPLDLLSDDRNLYSIMPYCDGGELFERLDLNERFSEDEARYWMHQVLTGLENLQSAGVCHRDMSLENLLVHQNRALIIDLGMCLRVPLADNTPALSSAFAGINMNGAPAPSTFPDGRATLRSLMKPQGTCGKWIYMSPEIYLNRDPFDGFAVDMWAAGVILFLMLTGFPPWERACATDERFKYMTAGYLVQMLTEWELGLSSDSMDLLQRMLFLDPKDRLSLDQVRAHPWMLTGQS
ncbi:activated protein kinase catalytic subunit alpha-1 [Seminavis robusta]|uniref:non-specific serine/threonine protein kinase n=1 Tax=Seminavis robusta TaxID=568900 RepID=A0A9N8DT48_9STRA|nr:activated protein kinase catalytic subunit alpha-1 [Seminavis robusta]|eukprot:Sro323_g117360.1 activated protein kinase catalytic subunit alpha-1 (481) ;mRNA; r:53210-54770